MDEISSICPFPPLSQPQNVDLYRLIKYINGLCCLVASAWFWPMKNSSRKWGGKDGKEVLNNYSSVHSLKSFLGLATSLDRRTQFLSRRPSVHDFIQVPFTAPSFHPYAYGCSNIPLGLLNYSLWVLYTHLSKVYFCDPNFFSFESPMNFLLWPCLIQSDCQSIPEPGLTQPSWWRAYVQGKQLEEWFAGFITLEAQGNFVMGQPCPSIMHREESSSFAFQGTVFSRQGFPPAMKEATGSRSLVLATWCQMCQAAVVCTILCLLSIAAYQISSKHSSLKW